MLEVIIMVYISFSMFGLQNKSFPNRRYKLNLLMKLNALLNLSVVFLSYIFNVITVIFSTNEQKYTVIWLKAGIVIYR